MAQFEKKFDAADDGEKEDLAVMRLSEVEEAQLRIVQQVRQLEEQGQVTIVGRRGR